MLFLKNQKIKLSSALIKLLQEGIRLRLDQEISKMKHAYVIWDTFAEVMSVEGNRMLKSEELEDFDQVEAIEVKNDPSSVLGHEEKKQIVPDNETLIQPSDVPDLDSDSDFEQFDTNDDPDDINVIKKPMHLYDIVSGLQSDNFDRYHITLENMESIIRK